MFVCIWIVFIYGLYTSILKFPNTNHILSTPHPTLHDSLSLSSQNGIIIVSARLGPQHTHSLASNPSYSFFFSPIRLSSFEVCSWSSSFFLVFVFSNRPNILKEKLEVVGWVVGAVGRPVRRFLFRSLTRRD
jgi:hypothetical protein